MEDLSDQLAKEFLLILAFAATILNESFNYEILKFLTLIFVIVCIMIRWVWKQKHHKNTINKIKKEVRI